LYPFRDSFPGGLNGSLSADEPVQRASPASTFLVADRASPLVSVSAVRARSRTLVC